MTLDDALYRKYLEDLLAGRSRSCQDTVRRLLDEGVSIRTLYADLFQRSLYEVGELWEANRITVAIEHLATSVTEGLLNLVYPELFGGERTGKKALISCSANEYHQVGGKMVADVFELHGWDGHFLGANTPPDEVVRHIEGEKPDLVGLSLSVPMNIDHLSRCIEVIRAAAPDLRLLIGGQAFRWSGLDVIDRYPGAEYVATLGDLERIVKDA